MSRFDEDPDGDPHGECSAEIDRLKALNAELAEALQGVIGWVPGRTAWHTDEPRKDVERACAALEKHKGETA